MRYSISVDPTQMASAYGASLSISWKHSTEICRMLRSRQLADAQQLLDQIITKKVAVPYVRYNWDLGHKRKIGPGRYPVKASQELRKLLDSVEQNALFKGLDKDRLVICHISASRAPTQWHYGRQRRRKMKRSHIQVVVRETVEEKPTKEAPA